MPHNGLQRSCDNTRLKIACVVLAVVFLNEYLVYFIQSQRWPKLPSRDKGDVRRQVILLVADPQIQGYQDELLFPVGTLARWDIDRYLRKTFSYAFSYSQPDVVVFLGDLFDEGSKATPWEYTATLDRFHSIFPQTTYTKTIYIPGDNDIGGEGMDFATHRKAKRFTENFGNITELIKFGFVDYIKLDITAYKLSDVNIRAADKLKLKRTSPFPIMLNHGTILPHPKHFVYPITRRLIPKVIFSAHWHKSHLFTCDDCLEDNEYSWTVRHVDLEHITDFLPISLIAPDFTCEISVPTSSYRMGEKNMGYGIAVVGEDMTMQYTVLWLPRRYTMLLGYLILILVFGIVHCVTRCTSRR